MFCESNNNQSFSSLLSARRSNLSLSEDDWWALQDSSLESYLSSFQLLTNREELLNHIIECKRTGLPYVAMDLMGSGKALEDLPADYIIGITLSSRTVETSECRTVLVGDILSKRTWKSINLWLDDNHHTYFNLITCRPEGGIHTIPDDINILAFLLSRTIHLLSPNNGMLITQLFGSLSKTRENIQNDLIRLIEDNLDVQVTYQPDNSLEASSIAAIKVVRL